MKIPMWFSLLVIHLNVNLNLKVVSSSYRSMEQETTTPFSPLDLQILTFSMALIEILKFWDRKALMLLRSK